MTTIDSLLSKKLVARSPNFLKLDVQGYELEVLKSVPATLSSKLR